MVHTSSFTSYNNKRNLLLATTSIIFQEYVLVITKSHGDTKPEYLLSFLHSSTWTYHSVVIAAPKRKDWYFRCSNDNTVVGLVEKKKEFTRIFHYKLTSG